MTGAPISPCRWRRIEELFHASIDLPQEQRDAFLRESCGPDDQLRLEIDSLLASVGEKSFPLNRSAAPVDFASASMADALQPKPQPKT